MVGWHRQLDGHEFEQALEVGTGQGGLACCSPCGRRVGHDCATELKGLYIPNKCHSGFYKFTSKYCQQEHILKFFLVSAEALLQYCVGF